MSRVFVANEVRYDRSVVIKVLSPELAAGLSVERFEREIGLAAGLQQANIVPVITSGDADGLPWYSMPFVDGESLRSRCRPERSEGPAFLPLAESISILSDIARALAYAHERGIVHRDIKPENVLLSGGTAVVTDFGIAKALSASRIAAPGGTLTQAGTSLGTPAYMAPEQAAGDDVDHRADIYAWGVVAYELLAGKHPFASKTTSQQLIAAHMAEVPASLTAQRPNIAQPIRDLVMRTLEKDPAKRPQSAKEILDVLSGGGAHLTPKTSRLTIGVVAAGLIAAAAIGAFLMQSRAATVRTAEAAGPITLAVLPFDNEGSDEQGIFTNGLTDAVTAKLGALSSLAVIDRRSASQYRQTSKSSKQIGTELGVRYLVEGVVRWAKDANGKWRAQVTPTLVDAASGNTRWTGESLLITPDDPFTAQSGIATKVADALQLALQPDDKARLGRRLSTSPDAFAGYLRARAVIDNLGRAPMSPSDFQRATDELERAVQLDPSFTEAWADLARVQYFNAVTSPSPAGEVRMRSTVARALTHAPDDPEMLLTLAWMRLGFDRDTSGLDSLVAQAVTRAPNDASVLSAASQMLAARGRPDTAYVLARRSAALNPRSALAQWTTGQAASSLRRWNEALQYSDAILVLDSADQRGWHLRMLVHQLRGDTVAIQREMERALAHVPRPDANLMAYMPYAGRGYASKFLAISARELGVNTLNDSVLLFLDPKADAALVLGDTARSRAYHDTLVSVVGTRRIVGFAEIYVLARLARAQAALGRRDAARATLKSVFASARARSARSDGLDRLDVDVVASTYAELAEPDSAVHWLTAAVEDRNGSWTSRGLAQLPNLRALHGTPAFAAFMKAHPE